MIELHTATRQRKGVAVEYSLQDDKGTANVKQVLSEESLLTYITENNLNVVCVDVYEGGVDFLDTETYLYDNLNEVVLGYLEGELV